MPTLVPSGAPEPDFQDEFTTVDAVAPREPTLADTGDNELAAKTGDRRLTPTLLRVFARRRKQVGVSIEQVARLSGISKSDLLRYEDAGNSASITYDQVVVLARVLGLSADELPGLRPREERFPLGLTLAALERSLLQAPLLRFEGATGERYGGDLERVAASKAFTVRIDDDSLQPALHRGTLLGFMNEKEVRPGAVVLLRHRRSSLLAMRRLEPTLYRGLMPWQPSYALGGEWQVAGSLEVTLPPRGP